MHANMADRQKEPRNMQTKQMNEKKEYKNKNKAKDPGYRRRYDLRNAKSLKKRVQDWYNYTKCPTVALTWLNGDIYYAGPEQLKVFADDPAVKQAFVSAVFALHSVGPNKEKEKSKASDSHSFIQVPKDWEQLNANGKRKLVIAIVTNNGTNKPYWNECQYMPTWWPGDIPFVDPNNGKERPSVESLTKVISTYSTFIQHDNDHMDTDSDSGSSRSNPTESDDNGNDDPAGNDLGPEKTSDGGTHFNGSCMDEPTSSGEDVAGRMFALLMENPCMEPEEVDSIIAFLNSVNDWENLKTCCDVVQRYVNFDQLVVRCQNMQVKSEHLEICVRCEAPEDMLRSGWEPARVKGDGNCLFRTVSRAITGDECDYSLLKLWCVVYGCLEEEYYVKQFLLDIERIDGFLALITDDDIYRGLAEGMSAKEKVQHVYRNEVTKTSINGRYSGYLQIVLLAGMLKIRIRQHCCKAGYELFNDEICPSAGSEDLIHLLWCSMGGGVVNHVVPLMQCVTNQHFNTFSDVFDAVCAADIQCQFHRSLDSGERERWIMCESCLLWYHESCVYYNIPRALPTHWYCGCSKERASIWDFDFNDPGKLRKFFVSSPGSKLKLFLDDLAKRKLKSRRITYFYEALHGAISGDQRLKANTGFGIITGEISCEYIHDFLESCLAKEKLLPTEIVGLSLQVNKYTCDVCIPEGRLPSYFHHEYWMRDI